MKKKKLLISNLKKTEYTIVLGSLIVIIILLILMIQSINDNIIYKNRKPIIELLGDQIIEVELNKKFVDPGVEVIDHFDKKLNDSVIIKGRVDTSEVGSYYLHYLVKNSKDIYADEVFRLVKVINSNPKHPIIRDSELEFVITEIVLEHQSELTQFNNDTCKMADYLSPFINARYDKDNKPERKTMRPLIKEVILNKLGIEQ